MTLQFQNSSRFFELHCSTGLTDWDMDEEMKLTTTTDQFFQGKLCVQPGWGFQTSAPLPSGSDRDAAARAVIGPLTERDAEPKQVHELKHSTKHCVASYDGACFSEHPYCSDSFYCFFLQTNCKTLLDKSICKIVMSIFKLFRPFDWCIDLVNVIIFDRWEAERPIPRPVALCQNITQEKQICPRPELRWARRGPWPCKIF